MSAQRIYIPVITFHPIVGGVEKYALLHAKSLHERGYETTIVTFRYNLSLIHI